MGAGCSKGVPEGNARPEQAPKSPGTRVESDVSKGAAGVAELLAEPTSAVPAPRKLTILHFNDIYNIEPAQRDPVGGAARFAAKVKEFRAQGANPLVLFSGDAYNPSLMSTMTMGAQMVPILNEIGVDVACIGNHDFDYGLPNLLKLNAQCKFPWLMANVLDRAAGVPFASAGRTWVRDWHGIRVGIVGLVEEEWLETLGAVNVADMEYVDFIGVAREAVAELKAAGAEVLIALTHMREPNDRRLAAEVPELHLVLGGHDHHYVSDFIQPAGNLLVKSGTDFRDLSAVAVTLPPGGGPPQLEAQRVPIVEAVPEDAAMAAIVAEYQKLMGEKMDEDLVDSLVELDGRFQTVRNRESNLGNFVCDVWRKAAGADIAILNSGSLRSDALHPAGKLKVRDFVAILPMVDETVVLECTGWQVLAALENGVSQWPKLEGRFPQVSGLRFRFDPSRPPGGRILPGSVLYTGGAAAAAGGSEATLAAELGGTVEAGEPEPLDMERRYRVAVKEYISTGHDGFTSLKDCRVLVDAESGVVLPTALKNFFVTLDVLTRWDPTVELSTVAAAWAAKGKSRRKLADAAAGPNHKDVSVRLRRHGLTAHHPQTGAYCIRPELEGRIVNVREEQGLAAGEGQAAGTREEVQEARDVGEEEEVQEARDVGEEDVGEVSKGVERGERAEVGEGPGRRTSERDDAMEVASVGEEED